MKWGSRAHLPVLSWGIRWDQVKGGPGRSGLMISLMTPLSLGISLLCRQEVCLLAAPELKSHSFYHWTGTGVFLPWVKELRLAPPSIGAHPWTRHVYLQARGGSCHVSFCCCLLREKDGLICQEKVAVLFRLNLRDALRSLGKYRLTPAFVFQNSTTLLCNSASGDPWVWVSASPLGNIFMGQADILVQSTSLLRIKWNKASKRN